MESLCHSANKESEDAYDVSTSLTGYEPNFLAFGELNDSSVPFSLHDPVIGPRHGRRDTRQAGSQRHTEHKPITANQKACQSVCRRLLCSMDQGNLWEKEISISQLILVSQETRTVLTASFLKTPELRKWSMDQGKPDERDSSNAQIRTLLEEQRQTIIAEYREKVGHHELQAAHAEEERRLLQGQ